LACGICAGRAPGAAEQPTLNPRVERSVGDEQQ
jgi:hypothetical protein